MLPIRRSTDVTLPTDGSGCKRVLCVTNKVSLIKYMQMQHNKGHPSTLPYPQWKLLDDAAQRHWDRKKKV